MPVFDARFFEWYVRYVVAPLDNVTRVLCNNWGVEALWCMAGLDYAKTFLGYDDITLVLLHILSVY